MNRLPRTIRLDPSDTFVFERAASPGEWAVSGAFVFIGCDVEALDPKRRTAFRSGLLGIESLAWSTLAVVSEASDAERDAAVERLAAQLVAAFGAPDMAAAGAAAAEEIAFASSLCDHPVGTLLAVQRSLEEGRIRERFRTLLPRPLGPGADRLHAHARAFSFREVEDHDQPAEEVDLRGLIEEKP